MEISRTVDIIQRWAVALNQRDFSDVAKMYHQQASLIPTYSNKMRIVPAEIAEYFSQISEHDHVEVSFDDSTIKVEELTAHCHLVVGIYSWEISNDGKQENVDARFTFIVGNDDEVPILHHHSSVAPV